MTPKFEKFDSQPYSCIDRYLTIFSYKFDNRFWIYFENCFCTKFISDLSIICIIVVGMFGSCTNKYDNCFGHD